MSFEPKILGFLCNWCSYAGADLAGVSRIQYPTNLRIIRVMCSGRVDPAFIIRAFSLGADGVAVLGCHPGDCHYISGNYETILKVKLTEKLLKLVDMEDRLMLDWVSAAEGIRFGEIVREFTDKVKSLGASPVSKRDEKIELLKKLQALERAAETDRLRLLVARQRKLIEVENVYGDKANEKDFNTILDEAVLDEYNRSRIFLSLKNDPNSVKNLAKQLELDSQDVLGHILALKNRGLVAIERTEGLSPIYITV